MISDVVVSINLYMNLYSQTMISGPFCACYVRQYLCLVTSARKVLFSPPCVCLFVCDQVLANYEDYELLLWEDCVQCWDDRTQK